MVCDVRLFVFLSAIVACLSGDDNDVLCFRKYASGTHESKLYVRLYLLSIEISTDLLENQSDESPLLTSSQEGEALQPSWSPTRT